MHIFEGVAFLLITWIVIAVCVVTRTDSVTCPPGTYANGVRTTGASECIRVGDDRGIGVRIYCSGGAVPIVSDRDGRTIGCQRRSSP